MANGTAAVYQFDSFVLDVGDRSLTRDGRSIPLTPKLFDLLVVLVANSGRLVEKDVLLATVWPDVVVEEASLTKGIFGLRQALAQTETRRYIDTVPKRGYRFVGPVAESPEPRSSPVPKPPPTRSTPRPPTLRRRARSRCSPFPTRAPCATRSSSATA